MTKNRTLYVRTREEWRDWLLDNFNTEKEIWLVYPHKNTGEVRILYNDAVEEALCFGWIDSTVKSFDQNHSIQRFTPRIPGSKFSQANIERLKWLFDRKMINPSIEKNVKLLIGKEFVFPPDIIDAIKKNGTAWENYEKFSGAYKRLRIAYIEGARKRPDEFKKRLHNFINKTKENKIIRGYGGVEKYYQNNTGLTVQ